MIAIENVTKSYNKKQVLNGVSLRFGKGVHGLLGPNGAGKTTLIRCVLGLVPFQGTVTAQGGTKNIGHLPQQFRMMEELTVEEALQYVAILKGTTSSEVPEAMRQTNLTGEKEKKVKHLSGGMLRRLGIAQALLGQADILLLDEPTVGLDPKERVHLRNLIGELGKTRCVLLSTHIVEDVEQIGDSIAVLHEGNVLIHEGKEALRQSMAHAIGEVCMQPEELPDWEKRVRVLQVQTEENGLRCRVFGNPLPAGVLPVDAGLEDIYLALIQNA